MRISQYKKAYRGRKHLIAVMAASAASLPALAGSIPAASAANTVALVGNSSVIVSEGPNHSLWYYWQAIGATSWHREKVAGKTARTLPHRSPRSAAHR